MKLLGKIENSLVYEVARGQYIIVSYDEESGRERYEVTNVWSNPLGRFAWEFTKCSSAPGMEDKCLEIIRKNKSQIAEKLKALSEAAERDEELARMNEETLTELDEKLASMEEGEVWDWDDDD